MPAPPPSSLTTQAVRGASWTIATSLGSRILGLVGTLAITYFMAPETLGQVSDASVLVMTANQLSTIGVGQYLIANPKAGPDVAWHASASHLGLGALTFLALFFLRDSFGHWLRAADLGLFIPGLLFAAVLDRIAFVPERLLARDMKFRTLGLSRTAGEVAYTVFSVAFAALHWGGMAIVVANVARSTIRAFLICRAVERKAWLAPSAFSGATTRAMLKFGLPYSVSASSGFAARRWDNLLISRLFGASVLGEYNLAYNLADIPAVQVGEQIGDVLLPSFANMEIEARKGALVRSTALLSLVVFPLAVGLGAVSKSAVGALLRPEWHNVAPMLTLLSALSVARPVSWTIDAYLVAGGKTRPMMVLSLVKVVLLLGTIATLGRVGPLAACTAVGVAFGLHSLFQALLLKRMDGISLVALLRAVVPPLLACIPLAAAVMAARAAVDSLGGGPKLSLAFELAAGAVGYAVGAWFLAQKTTRELLSLASRSLRKPKRVGVANDAGVIAPHSH